VQVAETRKEQIYSVSSKLFREKGYSATSMRSLAEQIGIEAASIYSHISSKEQILNDICFSMADAFFAAVRQAIVENENVADKLRAMMTAHIYVIINNIDKAAVFFHDWRHLSEEAKSKFTSLRAEYEYIYRKVISEGKEQGIFKQLNEKFVTLTLFSTLNWTYEWYKPGITQLNAEEMVSELTNIFFNGIVIN